MVNQAYFDNMASTQCHPEVVATLMHYLQSKQLMANPSSHHQQGLACQAELKHFEKTFLQHLGNPQGRIIWTSGATEAINLALTGLCEQYQTSGKHIITLATEHSATLETLKHLTQQGFSVSYLPVNSYGLVDVATIESAIKPDTLLVSIMHVHNEIGCVQDIQAIAKLCQAKGLLLHIDCAQSIGKACIKLPEGVTAASFSAHKCYGPKGIGALYLHDKPKRRLKRQIHGGAQQYHLRAGTIPLFLIAGFIKAIDLFHNHLDNQAKFKSMQALFRQLLDTRIQWNHCPDNAISQLLHLQLPQVDTQALAQLKNDFSLSNNSACQRNHYSHVLDAIGIPRTQQAYTLRIALAHDCCEADVRNLIAAINAVLDYSTEQA